MANDVINPEEMSSEQYGEALLQRKFSRAREYEKRARKDRRKDLAWQVLGGIDKVMMNRAALNVQERDRQLSALITKERADYQNLKKEWDSQEGWREAIKGGTDPYNYAAQLAAAELQALPKYSDSTLWGTLNKDDPFVVEFNGHVKRLAKQKLDAFNRNRVSLPAVSEDVYVAELEALKGQRVPAGLLNFVAEKIGFRDPVKLASIDSEKAKYADDLLTTRRGKEKALTPNTMADLGMYSPATGHLRKSTNKVRGQGKNLYMVRVDPNGNETLVSPDSVNMQDSIRLNLFPRDATDVADDLQSYKMNFQETATDQEMYAVLRDDKPMLYREAYNLGLIKGPTNKFSVPEQKSTIEILISKPIKEGGILTTEQIESIQHLPAGQVNFFIHEIIRNANHYSKKGYVNKSGEYVENPDDITAISAAVQNQIQGISYVELEGWFNIGEDRTTYDHRKYDMNKPSEDQTIDPEAATAFRRELSKNMEEWKAMPLEDRQKVAQDFEEKFDEPLGAEFLIEEKEEGEEEGEEGERGGYYISQEEALRQLKEGEAFGIGAGIKRQKEREALARVKRYAETGKKPFLLEDALERVGLSPDASPEEVAAFLAA